MLSKLLVIVIPAFLLASDLLADYRPGTDLISLHYDHAPDKDDGHATVAGLMVATRLRLTPHVVSGAYGDRNKHRYNSAAEAVMQATWGNNWTNAHQNWASSVSITANVWLDTINRGGNVFVAEGGQSDFSADVVRNIRLRSSIDTRKRITVVQHSTWNEQQTGSADLNYVKNQTNYVKIDDGNLVNSTADLFQRSSRFVTRALSSQFSASWEAAFQYLDPNKEKLDFSDTVELLYILGIGKNTVATVNDFADEFFKAPIADDTTPAVLPTDTPQADDTAEIAPAEENPPSSVPQESSPAAPEIDLVVPEFPVCSGNVLDTDSDGYGWENNQSCVIESSSSLPQVTAVIIFPPCNSATTDYDNDGYGWDNNQTCEFTSRENHATGPTPVTLISFPGCSADVADDNNDGYAWENGSTCVIAEANGANSISAITFPACSEAAIDTDGDGYGWENKQTCTFSNSAPISESNNGIAVLAFPVCGASVADTDGDGYGWENNMSCLVEATTGGASSAQQITTITGIAYPVCGSDVNDENSDGFGWQNGSSCIFPNSFPNPAALQPFPACSSNVVDYDADGYGWEAGGSCVFR